ncbi:glucoside xylosyltransferase 2-like [Tachypleus tridentatus]|uniref:glucoside xylosyltransferase 2-like n=1 Tax=Tachypleus tridentatus TaxID=6853 RepID=UPI003FD5A8E0
MQKKVIFLGLFTLTLIYLYLNIINLSFLLRGDETRNYKDANAITSRNFGKNWNFSTHVIKPIVLSTTICGSSRIEEAITMMKSAVAMSHMPLHFIIMISEDINLLVMEKLSHIQLAAMTTVTYEIHLITYPTTVTTAEWVEMFKCGSTQRLFLGSALPHVDALIYCDIDLIFLRPVEELWQHLEVMSENQSIAMSRNAVTEGTGWYPSHSLHPFFSTTGLNAGVMLLNLTRYRYQDLEGRVVTIYANYKNTLKYGDQDILNILLHNQTGLVKVLPCAWNFRTDFCDDANRCLDAEKHGVGGLHGNRKMFYRWKIEPLFFEIYESFRKFDLGTSFHEQVRAHLEKTLKEVAEERTTRFGRFKCNKLYQIFLVGLRNEANKSGY